MALQFDGFGTRNRRCSGGGFCFEGFGGRGGDSLPVRDELRPNESTWPGNGNSDSRHRRRIPFVDGLGGFLGRLLVRTCRGGERLEAAGPGRCLGKIHSRGSALRWSRRRRGTVPTRHCAAMYRNLRSYCNTSLGRIGDSPPPTVISGATSFFKCGRELNLGGF